MDVCTQACKHTPLSFDSTAYLILYYFLRNLTIQAIPMALYICAIVIFKMLSELIFFSFYSQNLSPNPSVIVVMFQWSIPKFAKSSLSCDIQHCFH